MQRYTLHNIEYGHEDVSPLFTDTDWFGDNLIDLFFARLHHSGLYDTSKYMLVDSNFLSVLIKRVTNNE